MPDRPFGLTRTAPIRFQPGALELKREEDLKDPVRAVKLIQSRPDLLAALHDGFGITDPDDEDGPRPAHRPRMAGSWPLLFCAFMLSRTASVEAWWVREGSSSIWRQCGFDQRPGYATVHRRFAELEAHLDTVDEDGQPVADGFRAAARLLIALGREHDPEIGRAVVVDGTAAATSSRLVHVCPPGSECGKKQAKRMQRRNQPVPALRDDTCGSRIPAAAFEDINAGRHEEQAAELDAHAQPAKDRRIAPLSDRQAQALGLNPKLRWWRQQQKSGEYHYFCCLDKTVGMRRYGGSARKPKAWLGWTQLRATDVLTGGPLDIQTLRADEQEYSGYAPLIDGVKAATGLWPQHMSGDRGLGYPLVYEHNTRRGIASSIPYRIFNGRQHRYELEDHRVDRHGVPRCQHCGAEGTTQGRSLGFTITRSGTPIINFRCALGTLPSCDAKQHVDCSHQWRLLQPVRRDELVYSQMRHAQSAYERVHGHTRRRYATSGRDPIVRDPRRGIGWQKLRAHAAMLLDWLGICARQGWLDGRTKSNPREKQVLPEGEYRKQILASRRKRRLATPYGPAAARLGLGSKEPPWRLRAGP